MNSVRIGQFSREVTKRCGSSSCWILARWGTPVGDQARRGADQCRLWIDALIARGVEVVVPEIADYEVRRELTRINASGSLRRLDDLVTLGGLSYQPISTGAWRHAALFWADARQRGIPTASPDALDSDVILAACAATIGHPGDQILVAMQNVGHLARYCDARLWTTIA